jgi:hypothetical protein
MTLTIKKYQEINDFNHQVRIFFLTPPERCLALTQGEMSNYEIAKILSEKI